MKTRELYLEFSVGLFMLLGLAAIGYMSVKLAKKDFFDTGGYPVHALFSNVGGLSPGAPVEIAGVQIGRVKEITLDDYDAKVLMIMNEDVELQEDVIASIKTNGLFGEKFVEIVPGGVDEIIQPGGIIIETEPAMDFEGLISKFVHGKF